MSPPSPTRERWQPLRCGLIDLYRYDEQEFRFVEGRLLLRGNNGTGKTRVLALTLPFLLDGETSPHRFEPDGDPNKRVEWNLLMDKHDDRRGCTWIEFGRRDADGTEHFRTLACQLHAVKGRGLHRFFFLSRLRVGAGLQLIDDNRRVLGRDRLRAAHPDGVTFYDTVETWRDAVDRELFGLGPRYRALMDLLVQLRKPQLSRQLDEGVLSEALSKALAPLSLGVVEPLAEAFRGLETDRDQLEAVKEAIFDTDRFLERYRSYARVASRRRAGELRARHASYEGAGRAVRRAMEERDAAARALEGARAMGSEVSGRLQDARSEVEALERDPTLDRARELERAEADVIASMDAHRDAAGNLARWAERYERQGAEYERAMDGVVFAALHSEEALARVRGAAVPLDLVDALGDEGTWRDRFDRRSRDAEVLAKCEGVLSEARRVAEGAERSRDLCQSDLDSAREDEQEKGRSAGQVRARWGREVEAWATGCRVLGLPSLDELLPEADAWAEDAEGRSPVAVAAAEAHAVATREFASERGDLRASRGPLAEGNGTKRSEVERLREGGNAPPRPSVTRTRDASRAGAPLWALCSFADELGAEARAGLEAALEGAGLLDAWVTPDGALMAEGALDASLTLDAPVVPRSVHGALVAVDHDAVPRAVVEGVLSRIGMAEGDFAVGADGRYRLGPLRGQWKKSEAEHVGETARAQARERRIAELLREVAEIDARIEVIDARIGELARLEGVAKREVTQCPDESGVRDAVARLRAAGRHVDALHARLDDAEERFRALRDAVVKHEATRDSLAADLRFEGYRGRPEALRSSLGQCSTAAVEFFGRERSLREAERSVRRAEEQRADAQAERDRAEAREGEASSSLRGAAVRRDTLRENYGASIHEVIERLQTAKAQRDGLAREETRQRKAVEVAVGEASATGERVGSAEEAQRSATEARETALERVRGLVRAGMFELLGLTSLPVDAAAGRVVEAARAVEAAFAEVATDEADWARVQDGVYRGVEELRQVLLPNRWEPTLHSVDELLVAEVTYGDGRLGLAAFDARLRDDRRAREEFLTAREREVIETHLVGELASELHERIQSGEKLVREMSDQVEQRSTSTGMRLRFHWRVSEAAGASVVAAREKILRRSATWSPADRELIAGFLRGRLDDEQGRSPTSTWQQKIEAAFDYRAWHHFVVERQQDNVWKPLTRRTHGTGSGGEKAIALTIPQLAAAAAYYKNASPLAPRVILLDEAFVGIDGDMRAKCMGLLASFDLDFVITSEREWGCYATLPGVSICQLAAAPGIDAIDVVHWTWNGRERRAGE